LSGTGTVGATLRVYIEDASDDPSTFLRETQHALSEMISIADHLAGIAENTGRTAPDVRT
jgi:phosphoglucomutase